MSTGHVIGSAMTANADRSAATAASRPDGRCGICGDPRDRPSVKLCPHHPGLTGLSAGDLADLTRARAAWRAARFI